MSLNVGVWIDHKQAVIVSASEGHVTTQTLDSAVGPHTHYAGSQDAGGEKKYEGRHGQHLGDYYDEVIGQLGRPEALLIFGPGEAKGELKERIGHIKAWSGCAMAVESTDKMTDPQIVAKVRDYFGITL